MGILQSLGLTPVQLGKQLIGKLFGSLGMPNPASLLHTTGGASSISVPEPNPNPTNPTIQQAGNLPPIQPINQQTAQLATNASFVDSPTSVEPSITQNNKPQQSVGQQQQILKYIFPTKSQQITSGFGNRPAPTPGASTFHQGVDIGGNAQGSPLNAFTSGKVIDVGQNNGLGNFMKMLGDDGRTYTYGHAQNFAVQPGQQLTAGQQVGAVGNTGISTAPHLHFMASEQGKYIDPSILFKKYLGQ